MILKKAQRVRKSMKTRCRRNPVYSDVSICEEWLEDPQSFYKWYAEQPNAHLEDMQVDKDLLSPVNNNKVYSPETCCLIPRAINQLLVTGPVGSSGLPVGVSRNGKGYKAGYSAFGKKVQLPTRETPQEAREDYLKAKKAHVKYMVTESPYAALLAPKVVSAILAWDRF